MKILQHHIFRLFINYKHYCHYFHLNARECKHTHNNQVIKSYIVITNNATENSYPTPATKYLVFTTFSLIFFASMQRNTKV